jgi:hypothetical protein
VNFSALQAHNFETKRSHDTLQTGGIAVFTTIIKGKASHWFAKDRQNKRWRERLRIEDSLTGLTFDAFRGLSGVVLGKILQESCPGKPVWSWLDSDTFEISLWPRVGREPDVLIVDKRLRSILIVEAKLEDLHSKDQLYGEVRDVRAVYPNFEVSLIAIGSNAHLFKDLTPKGCKILATATWDEMARSVDIVQKSDLSPAPSEMRILRYLSSGLSWFGFRPFHGLRMPRSCGSLNLNDIPHWGVAIASTADFSHKGGLQGPVRLSIPLPFSTLKGWRLT